MWVTVKDFDRDVKVGDRVKMISQIFNGEQKERLITGIAEETFVYRTESDCEFISSKINRYGDWQVWREPKNNMSFVGIINTVKKGNSVSVNIDTRWESKEQAQEYADECKKVAERLHERWGE